MLATAVTAANYYMNFEKGRKKDMFTICLIGVATWKMFTATIAATNCYVNLKKKKKRRRFVSLIGKLFVVAIAATNHINDFF